MIASDSQPPLLMQHVETKDDLDYTESMHYDSSVLTTTSYPLVASIYMLGLAFSGNMTAAISEALLLYCRTGGIIYSIGLQAFLLAIIFDDGRGVHRSARQTVPYVIVNNFEAVLRPFSWYSLWNFIIIGITSSVTSGSLWVIVVPVCITTVVAFLGFFVNEYRPGTVISLYSTMAAALITTANYYLYTNENLASQACKHQIRVIPPSSAKLTDLDQIVALVIALVWFCGARTIFANPEVVESEPLARLYLSAWQTASLSK